MANKKCYVCGKKLKGTEDTGDALNYYCPKCFDTLMDMVDDVKDLTNADKMKQLMEKDKPK